MRKLIITATLFLTVLSINAQSSVIDSLKIIPANPASNDVVKIMCHSTHFNKLCRMTDSSVVVNDTIINISATHEIGVTDILCYSTDTIPVGILNAGNYTLIYNLNNMLSIQDVDTIYFTVAEYTSLMKYINNNNFIIYPNPADGVFSVEINDIGKVQKIETVNIIGETVCTVLKPASGVVKIDLSAYPKGIYFVKVISDEVIKTGKVILQ